MGVVDGSTNWNGQDNFVDFIQFAADKVGMTREEYMAHYGRGIDENKKPGPDPYHRGLDDDEVEDKEDQIKKQAKMDDDDPDAYKEMPGDKEAREKGEVKTSKATKAYNKLYSEALDEGTMSDIHQMAGEAKSKEDFLKKFFKEYGAKIKKSKDSEEWASSLYDDTIEEANHSGNEASDKMAYSQLERIIDYATMLRDRMAAGKGLDAWMYGKVIKAEDYLNTLYDVVDGDDGVVETQKMTNKDWKKIKKFNKHITDSGEKFVMSYDDRIGTFLEPVEIVEEGLLGQVRSRIGKTQTALKKKWDKKGGYENFGQDEIRKLQDEYDYNSMVYGTPEQRKAAKLIDALDQWAMNYVGEATTVNEDDKDQKSTDRGPLDDDKIETALKKKAQDTGVPIGIIRAVMRRGLAAWKSGHRPGANQQQWGYARVNAFLTKGEGTWGGADKDLAKEVRDGGHDKKLKKA